MPNQTLKKVKDITSRYCVTILLNTHRTIPDNEKDPIVLKNLVKEAQTRLLKEKDQNAVKNVINKMEALAGSIDHRHNLESLVLFVNEDMAEYIRLPISVEERVVLDDTFATRDIFRAIHMEKGYYVLVLSRDKARLIEAFNDKVIEEVSGDFPVDNISLYPLQKAEAAIAARQTHLQQEFFNVVDKRLVGVINKNPLEVFLSTEESNYHQYLKIADKKEFIIGYLNGNRMGEKNYHIIDAVLPEVKKIREEEIRQRLNELNSAAGAGKVLTDLNDIWRAVKDGRGKTLFVKQGFFQPARINNGVVEVVKDSERDVPGIVDDIIDEMIEFNSSNGGDSVFVTGNELDKYQGLALTTRY